MAEEEEQQQNPGETTEEESVSIHIREYDREISYLKYQAKKYAQEQKDIEELKLKNKKRGDRYTQRAARLGYFPNDPEKWYKAELDEVERVLKLALRENITSVYNDGLTTVDFVPMKIVRKVDPTDEDAERQYELKWETLHQYTIEILEDLNKTHPKFTYEIDLVHLPEKACVFCAGTDEPHCCKAQNGLLRIKKISMKVPAECLPVDNTVTEEEQEEEEKKEPEETASVQEEQQQGV